uniref:D-xylose 1-dehydrogenase (NADP(+), D-xylono-1,5-lactone-forming) n=1 Tax=Bionectria ochroleuca TaxID=29856 RepID=A0A0B7K8B1_BIOOC
MSSKKTTIRWGLMATGDIARLFAIDLLINPETRGTQDIHHVITAVASSSSIKSAERFISQHIAPRQSQAIACLAYSSYEEIVQDANVDIVYIASPHSHHFQNCMLAMEYNKPILCEKPLTVNANQAQKLYETAKQKNIFLMEAVWTRFFPLSIKVRQLIQDGEIGEVLRVYVDNSTGVDISKLGANHRYLDMGLAGGALLDIGIYPLIWVFQTMYHTREKSQRQKPSRVFGMLTYEKTSGTDQMVSAVVEFPASAPNGNTASHGIMATSMVLSNDPDDSRVSGATVRIQGLKGEIQVHGPVHRPEWIRIIHKTAKDGSVQGYESRDIHYDIPAGGHGMYWEADEAARCIRDGKIESFVIPWDESVTIMQVVDKIRAQAGYTYPEEIESTQYPLNLKKRTVS